MMLISHAQNQEVLLEIIKVQVFQKYWQVRSRPQNNHMLKIEGNQSFKSLRDNLKILGVNSGMLEEG